MSVIRFYNVSPLLANHVRNYSLFEPKGNTVERVTPNGSIEIEIQIDPVKARKESVVILSRFAKPRFVRPDDLGRYFVIGFYPWAVRPFLNMTLTEVTDQKISLEDIFDVKIKFLQEQVLNAKDEKEMIAVTENYLITTLYNPSKNDTLVAEAARHILNAKGMITVEELSGIYNISERRLQQRFKDVMGISPKVYARQIKFQHALSLIRGNKTENLTDVAYLSGYFDQAHFIHEFQSFSGTSPKKYRSENHVIDTLNASASLL